MTSRQQVVFGTVVDPDWVPVFTTPGPMELVLAEAMPEVCSEHGLAAVERRSVFVNSHGPHSEWPTLRGMLMSVAPFRPRLPVAARVRFDCPACEFCLAGIRRSRWIAVLALLAVVLTIAGIFTAVSLELRQLYVPLALAFLPGCVPIALLVAVLAWSRSGFFADVWMNQDADELIVSAHPDFVAAVAQCRAERR
ncbi:hypothetical protein [Nocardia sp. NPDC051833]|uniref:hypothetical protein n=1 Tax=Nocardia sp. NPDC051833 TaxID=3155674 RepID=UPI0034391AED